MSLRRRLALVGVVAVVLLAAAVTTLVIRLGSPHPVAAPEAAARTSFPGLAAATSEPTLASLATLRPSPGTVAQAAGPFDDRFALSGLAFDGSVVTGRATITSDVSDILEFEALAGFYDKTGALIGTGRYVYHLDESTEAPQSAQSDQGPPDEVQRIRIPVPPELKGRASSAAVGVPVLVNE